MTRPKITIVMRGVLLGLVVAAYTAVVAVTGAYINSFLALWAALAVQLLA